MPGILYLIPTLISPDTQHDVIAPQVKKILPLLSDFLVEDIRSARRFLSSLKIYSSMEELRFQVLNKETQPAALPDLMKPLLDGKSMGILSESGCPGVADPGAIAVHFAHQHQVKVVPLVGPSSILLALMASGLNGQQFAFHGYLPVKANEASKKIQELERESKTKNQTQIFIETAYRNNSVFELLIKNLHASTQLTVAVDITGKEETVRTQSVDAWKKQKPLWPKQPAIFLFLACVH
jgi:16S rRNA (cytidine1402-2'-O)-methyltransferase